MERLDTYHDRIRETVLEQMSRDNQMQLHQAVAAAIEAVRPFGVDTASGVESAPGIKDASMIADFVAAARDRVPSLG